jgi:hypothetical protein
MYSYKSRTMREELFIFLGIIVFILILYAVLFMEKSSYMRVPKKIWTYCPSLDKLTKVEKLCIESWKRLQPEYEIVMLTPENVHGYVIIPNHIVSHPIFRESSKRFSDLVRLFVLVEHGGIWMDLRCILNQPLEKWLFSKYADYSGFFMKKMTTQKEYPHVVESFIACNKGCEFIKKWRDEFVSILDYPNVAKYVESRIRMEIQLSDHYTDPIGNAIQIAAQKVIQVDRYPLDSVLLNGLEDGPMSYLTEAKWNSEKGLQLLCSDTKKREPLLILREEDCNELNKRIDFDLSNDICKWV